MGTYTRKPKTKKQTSAQKKRRENLSQNMSKKTLKNDRLNTLHTR